ncbi:MAG: hypothetical protein JNK64_36090 [Myxococcales bacterium]|nr:hypothetical protein [Myxococcales bacterium]
MRPGSIALAVGSAIVAVGGLYLLVELRRGAAAPSPAAGEPARVGAARPTPAPERAPVRASPGPMPAALGSKRPEPPPSDSAPMVAKLEADRAALGDAVLSVETSEHLLEANKLYDRGDYDGARQLAIKLLTEAPGNVRLLRVVVSSSCILGDAEQANQYAPQLPPPDRDQMADRCAKFQIALK